MNSGRVVRGYPNATEAKAAMTNLRSTVQKCRSWRDGSWQYNASRWDAAALPRDSLPWRAKVAIVGGLGVVYLLVGLLGVIVPDLFGLLPHEYETVLDKLIHLALGVLGIALGFFIGDRAVDRAPR